jgi:DNA-binding NtrC family response regulator
LRRLFVVQELQNQHRVFVVDDERIISSTLAMILTLQGFDATAYTQPLEALKAARCKAPDLLISDVMMPELSGIDLSIQVQESCPSCRVLLFSGQATTMDLLETARTNGHAFELLTKPVHPTELLKKVREVLQGAPQAAAIQAT